MKKIMAVLLAVAVIFTFAACENGTTVNPYFGQQVQRIVFESAPDYVVGESINPADVKVLVEYDNGSTILTGEDVGMYRTEGYKVVEADGTKGYVTLNFNYGSDNPYLSETPAVKDWHVNVPVYSISKIKVDASSDSSTVETTDAEVSLSTISKLGYTVVYTKGTEEVERTVSYVDLLKLGITVSGSVTTDDVEPGEKVYVSVSAKQVFSEESEKNVPVEVTPKNWQVAVIEDQKTVIKNVEIAQDTKKNVFNIEVPADDEKDAKINYTGLSNNTIADLPWTITITLGDDSTITLDGKGEVTKSTNYSAKNVAEVSVDFVDFTKTTTTLAAAKTNEFKALITVKLSGTDAKNFTKIDTLSVTYTKDYPTVIAADLINKSEKYYEGSLLNIGLFKFYNVEMASGLKYTDKAYSPIDSSLLNSIQLVTTSVDWGQTKTDNYPVNFKWIGDKNKAATIEAYALSVENRPTEEV